MPCGQINTVAEAFAQPQAVAREMTVRLPHPVSGHVDLIGNPIRMSETPVAYQGAPPMVGQHTRDVLSDVLGADEARLAAWAEAGAIGELS